LPQSILFVQLFFFRGLNCYLYERFNLNVPLYDGGKRIWRKTHAGQQPPDCEVSKEDWLEEPFVIQPIDAAA
jgi:hypothetical protein